MSYPAGESQTRGLQMPSAELLSVMVLDVLRWGLPGISLFMPAPFWVPREFQVQRWGSFEAFSTHLLTELLLRISSDCGKKPVVLQITLWSSGLWLPLLTGWTRRWWIFFFRVPPAHSKMSWQREKFQRSWRGWSIWLSTSIGEWGNEDEKNAALKIFSTVARVFYSDLICFLCEFYFLFGLGVTVIRMSFSCWTKEAHGSEAVFVLWTPQSLSSQLS